MKPLFDEAYALLDQGKYQQAENIAERAFAKLKTLPNQTETEKIDRRREHASFLSLCGAISRHRGDFQTALIFFSEAYQEMIAIDDHNGAMGSANLIGNVYQDVGNFDKALEFYQIALDGAIQYGAERDRAGFQLNIGNIWQTRGRYDKAMVEFTEALDTFKSIGSEIHIALGYERIGTCYCDVGVYDKALEFMSIAMRIYEEQAAPVKAALVMGNIAQVYYSINSNSDALLYAQKALASYEQYGMRAMVARTIGNIGSIYWRIGDYNMALENMKRALEIHETIGQRSSVALVTGNMGNVYLAMGKYDKAIEYTTRALQVNTELKAQRLIASNYGFLGGIYAGAQFQGFNVTRAMEYIQKAIEIYEAMGSGVESRYLHQSTSTLLATQKRWREAYEHYKRFSQLEKEALNDETKNAVENFNIRVALLEIERSAQEQRVKAEQLEQQSKRQQGVLSHKALQIVQQTDAIQKMRSNLEVIVVKAETAEAAINAIRRSLVEIPEKMLNWEKFCDDFRNVHPDFERNLTKTYPLLSATEIKVCCLLLIGMNTREISTLLFVSERTVDIHRGHIRRKLAIKRTEEIGKFLFTITNTDSGR